MGLELRNNNTEIWLTAGSKVPFFDTDLNTMGVQEQPLKEILTLEEDLCIYAINSESENVKFIEIPNTIIYRAVNFSLPVSNDNTNFELIGLYNDEMGGYLGLFGYFNEMTPRVIERAKSLNDFAEIHITGDMPTGTLYNNDLGTITLLNSWFEDTPTEPQTISNITLDGVNYELEDTQVREDIDNKQDKLVAGNGIDITDNKISTNTQFVITEDMFDLEYDATKGVSPYNTSYGYTNVTIHEDAGIEWVEGASYTFVLDTKVSTSNNRNVRVRIGEDGDWKPIMVTTAIATGSTVFIKAVNPIFFYKTVYQPNGALHVLYDTNTTYTINYSIDAGQKKAGIGAYAVSRYSLIMQKLDMTWEKITDTSKTYSTATTKTVNTRGFLLNQIRYYNYTTNYANGALMSASYVYSKSASINASYSFNCGTAPNWAIGDYVYLVGTVKDDGLFYLDTNQWWSNALPTTNDGKLYIQLGIALTTTDSTMSFYSNRPIYYHDGTGIKQYLIADNKQNTLVSGTNIKTINGESIVGSGDITIKSALPTYEEATETLIFGGV